MGWYGNTESFQGTLRSAILVEEGLKCSNQRTRGISCTHYSDKPFSLPRCFFPKTKLMMKVIWHRGARETEILHFRFRTLADLSALGPEKKQGIA